MKLISAKYLVILLLSFMTLDIHAQEVSNNSLTKMVPYVSDDRSYYLLFQNDGNLVVYNADQHAIWSTQTDGKHVTQCVMQSDGNLVLYDGKSPLWDTKTYSYSGTKTKLVMQNDGNLVILGCLNNLWVPLWSSMGGKWSHEQIDGFLVDHPADAAKCCANPPCNDIHHRTSGVIHFTNTLSTPLFFYYFYLEKGVDEVASLLKYSTLEAGHSVAFTIPPGKAIAYRFYTEDTPGLRDNLKFYGSIANVEANGQYIYVR